MNTKKLEQNLIDLVKEQQAKLGYRKESVQLFYPLSSLQHILECHCDITKILYHLNQISDMFTDTLGHITITHSGEQFCFHIPPEGSEWVHQHISDTEFIVQLVELVGRHGCTMDKIFHLFEKQDNPVHTEQVSHGEFDYLIYFESGEDNYYYCFKKEGEHMIYHRFLPEDYADFNFN
ncbi:MAG: DUF3877 family protein [Lachnospiraceae bacterium]|nr:DUF3877 family protein [Lachnospiraceae bacterium]